MAQRQPEPPTSAPRILVTDAQDRAGLAAVRCLNASGYHVTAAAIDRGAPGLWSRHCSARRLLPDPREDGVESFVERLEGLLREQRHDVLLAVRDETVYALSAHRERIAPLVETGLPAHNVVERAMDKVLLTSEAAKVGLATPDGRVCEDIDQALDAARTFGFPVIVKGVRSVEEAGNYSVRYPSRLAWDEPALRDLQRTVGTCIVQRRAIGPVVQFGAVATDDGLVGRLLTRSSRTWPPEAGNPSYIETITIPGDLAERVAALVAAIGWRGLFQIELIELPGGALRLIDFNPRPYGSIGLARAAGAPLVSLWCAWLLGERPLPATAPAGFAYRWEVGDMRHILWGLRNGHRREALAAAAPRRRTAHAYFDRRDPVPFFAHCAELAGVRWRHAGEARLQPKAPS